jgi:succinate dehydrogenase/fumarate reductase flavoprotein subunit
MFMKGTAAGAMVGTTGGWMAESQDAAQAAQSRTYSFEIPPPPISARQIKETITTEVVIIGAGTSGLVCANAAVENGAKIVVIASSPIPISRGGSNHAFNSKLMRKLGLKSDVAKEFKNEMKCHSFRIDQDKWWLWAHKSGEAMDWLIDKMEAAGYKSVIEMGNTDPDGIMTMYPGSHSWLGKNMEAAGRGQQLVVDTLAKTAQAHGVQIYFNTTAVQLVREDHNAGRVNAVIAKTPEGTYTRYVGTKAIVLATGDFKDEEMVEKYCPWVLPLVKEGGGVYSGDGHKMALWVGASWQKTVPNAPMILGRVGPETQPYRAFTGLLVNKNAVRYGNEDRLGSFAGLAQMQQPDTTVFPIWDAMYAERAAPWTPAGSYYGGSPQIPVQTVVEAWEANVRAGTMVKADTIEGLAQRLGLPVAPLKATIERYNGFCKSGIDAEYCKRAPLLIPIETAPFYGAISKSPQLLCISGGLRTNIKMQVLDKNERVIPGLYAVGTIVGDMYSNIYTFLTPGHNLGANCVTFGYLVGKDIAREGKISL